MRKVESGEQLSKLAERSLDNSFETNFYTLPDKFNEYAAGGKLFYDDYEGGGLVLYEDRGEFHKVYIFTSSEGGITLPEAEKPMVGQIVYSERRGIPKSLDSFYKGNGFEERNKLVRIEVRADAIVPAPAELPEGYRLEFLSKKYIPDVLTLLRNTFDAYTHDLPDYEEALKIAEEKRALCILNPSGEVCAYRQWTWTGDSVLLSHICAIESEKRRGFSKILDNKIYKTQNANSFWGWVLTDNEPSFKQLAARGWKIRDRRMISYFKK